LERAYEEFASDGAFNGHTPTREQVARAWAFARFKKDDENEVPHDEVVTALKKLFPEFRDPKRASVSRTKK
jgi:hypothetical protein